VATVGVVRAFDDRLLSQNIPQIIKGHESIRLRRLDDAVENGAGIGTTLCICEEPVFPADHEGFNCPFDPVVVDLQLSMFDIAN
jgi:hypothetical protein